MDVLILLLFVSLVLVLGALLLFAKAITGGDFEHGDRLALLPLESEGRIDTRSEVVPLKGSGGIQAKEESPRHE